jgi:hypothetical protein
MYLLLDCPSNLPYEVAEIADRERVDVWSDVPGVRVRAAHGHAAPDDVLERGPPVTEIGKRNDGLASYA